MPGATVPIEPDLLQRLYVDERWSADQIATRLGCTPTTIYRRLRQLGIQCRPRGPARHDAPPLPAVSHPDVSYAVGLAATDGNLSGDGRHMSFVSKDRDLVETF